MRISYITARYKRTVQVQKFEPADAEVEMQAVVTEGEVGPEAGDAAVKAAQQLLINARTAVNSVLLGAVHASRPAEGGAVIVTPPAAPAPVAAMATPPAEPPKVEKPAKVTKTKKEEKPAGDIPDEDPAPAKSAAAPAKSNDGIPDEEPKAAKTAAAPAPAAGGLTANSLQAYIATHIKAHKLTVPQMRDVMENDPYKVERLGDLSAEQLITFKAKIDDLIKAAG